MKISTEIFFDDIVTIEDISANSRLSVGRGLGNGNFSFSSIDLSGITSNTAEPPLFSINAFTGVSIVNRANLFDSEIVISDFNSPLVVFVSIENAVVSQDSVIESFAINAESKSIKSGRIDSDDFDDIVLLGDSISVLLSSQNYEEKIIVSGGLSSNRIL